MILYSVIIPFKGDFSFLKRALSSIPSRKDIQVIVADDNDVKITVPDTDCFDLCYVHLSEHHGAGHARNVGLQHVRGEFVVFCDADDFFSLGAFETFDRAALQNNDITFFGVDSIRLCDGRKGLRHLRKRFQISQYRRTSIEDNLRYRWDAPWGKMYKASFLREGGFVFDETPFSNDDMFSVRTGYAASTIGVVDEVVYVVSDSRGYGKSLTSNKSSEAMFVNYCVHLDKMSFLRQVGRPDLTERLWMHELRVLFRYGFSELKRYHSERKRRGI